MLKINLPPGSLPPNAEKLRSEVRDFLAKHLSDYSSAARAKSWAGSDPAFSELLGQQGWIGMTWPSKYGGAERSALERYVVLEEMLAAGAPVAAHWIADRQSGPLLLNFGTEKQRQKILPAICRGHSYFCIGMSEPNSGSDLASIRTKGVKTKNGWQINGSKLWTSKAHIAHYMIALVRTAPPNPKNRHAGLSQFIIDMKRPGITIRPIRNIAGDDMFNEVFFEDLVVPNDMLVGREGEGWSQVTAELALERSGPERYLSSYQLLYELVSELSINPKERNAIGVGRLVAHLATLRQMSMAVAVILEDGRSPELEAAFVKEAGVAFEQGIPSVAHDLVGRSILLGAGNFDQVMAYVTQAARSFSLRGGTREIVRGIIARGLGLR
ncbi:MAG: acyl-CoA dehydrogenase [Rhodospirillaceae bacterium TMED8]|nr:acyl-CoA dehydrogenase [Magnetovibrio sp.]OUT51333.1 MAG: acyl-CoA dehydrogenase [Rhodospirillaceae bacterium TMED8]|tara:strand:- start:67 stop:1215 length:1149 start_codon:yes stop_codon:yes gene_type:complete